MTNAIELRNLSKTYPLFKLDQISLDVKQGYITGLIGPNGAGKSTLISLITGLIRPDSGSIRTLGNAVPAQEVNVKERIGIVSDECFYYEHLTIREMKSMIAPFIRNGMKGNLTAIWSNSNCLPKEDSGTVQRDENQIFTGCRFISQCRAAYYG